jgi:hypothetical protein
VTCACETADDVEVEPAQVRIAERTVDAGGNAVHEQRNVLVARDLVKRIEVVALHRRSEVRADRAADQSQRVHRPRELFRRGCGILHRQRGEPREPVAVTPAELRERVVPLAAVRDRLRGIDEVEVGERARREDLVVDARRVHRLDPQLGVGERALRVPHTLEAVVADAIPGLSLVVDAIFGAVRPVGPHVDLDADVRMAVDDAGVVDASA